MRKKEGEEKGSARGSVHWGTAGAATIPQTLTLSLILQRRRFGRREADVALQASATGRKPRAWNGTSLIGCVAMTFQQESSAPRSPGGPVEKETQKPTACCMRTVCPVVHNNGPNTPTSQSCMSPAPRCQRGKGRGGVCTAGERRGGSEWRKKQQLKRGGKEISQLL